MTQSFSDLAILKAVNYKDLSPTFISSFIGRIRWFKRRIYLLLFFGNVFGGDSSIFLQSLLVRRSHLFPAHVWGWSNKHLWGCKISIVRMVRYHMRNMMWGRICLHILHAISISIRIFTRAIHLLRQVDRAVVWIRATHRGRTWSWCMSHLSSSHKHSSSIHWCSVGWYRCQWWLNCIEL